MSLEADALVDRRRLKRRLVLWRLAAIVAIAIVVPMILFGGRSFSQMFEKTEQVARVNISGLITDNDKQQEMLRNIRDADHVKAVLLRVNSPGGTTTGAEALYESIRNVAEKKPVVAVFGTVATSAAYIAGLASDHIVSRGNTITGSVGVVMQWAELTELLKSVGVKMEVIKSGRLKAVPSPFEPAGPGAREVAEKITQESYQWFVRLVSERRKVSASEIIGLKDGRVYTGWKARELKLVDEIGGEPTARAWLDKVKGVSRDLKVVDWKPESDRFRLFGSSSGWLARALGLSPGIWDQLWKENTLFDRLKLDGLVSLWHPSRD